MAHDGETRWQWSNVPVPEPHIGGLVAGIAIHLIRPWHVAGNRVASLLAGLFLIGVAVLMIAWAVRTIGGKAIEQPTALVTIGPYRISRNPMYVAWTGLYVGVALLINTAWLFVLFPVVLGLTHVIVRREERLLEQSFGEEYRAYKATVRRYL